MVIKYTTIPVKRKFLAVFDLVEKSEKRRKPELAEVYMSYSKKLRHVFDDYFKNLEEENEYKMLMK